MRLHRKRKLIKQRKLPTICEKTQLFDDYSHKLSCFCVFFASTKKLCLAT